MVRKNIFYVLLILFSAICSTDALETINVSAEVQWNNIYEDQPIQGFVSVTHDLGEKVDAGSFKVGGKPLKVSPYKEVKFAENSPLVVTTFSFEIPGMPKGLQLLPAISVNVNGKTYQSTPSTFEVHAGGKQQGPFLKLETFYEGASPLYPGQRALVGYRYLYNVSVELSEEYLPLLDAEGLRKIGDKDIKDLQQGNVSISQITQAVEAVKPGEFKFGPSVVKGTAYVENPGSRRTYFKPELSAEAPAVAIIVRDFPAVGRPASFRGAVGQFNFTVSMLTPQEVRVNDKVELKMTVSGAGQLENLQPPDLCCQPGFSGLFKPSDLPPVGKIEGNAKTFIVPIYPLSTLIDSVPPVEFSFFDPNKGSYQSVISSGIPITVLPPVATKNALENPLAAAAAEEVKEKLLPIEIEGNYPLSSASLRNSIFGSYKTLLVVPLCFLLIFFQVAFKQDLKSKKLLAAPKRSAELLKKASHQLNNEAEFFHYLTKSFNSLLFEKKLVNSEEISFENWPDAVPEVKLVKRFFKEIEELRFSGKGKISLRKVLSEAQKLYKSIEEGL